MAKNINQAQIERLQQLLSDTGARKVDLATYAGVSQQAVNNWFKYGHVSKDSASKIAAALNISVDWLLYGQAAEPLNQHLVRRDQLAKWFGGDFPEEERQLFEGLLSGGEPFGYQLARRLEEDYQLPHMYLDSQAGEDRPSGNPILSEKEKKLIEYFQQFPEATKDEMLQVFREKVEILDNLFNELKKLRNSK
ncbi:helix-turn-helix domain-containing protein [Lelliottia wanjuensis]|uniref:helix-turn-helix domain-containing protein n=1 Tax=Lelliottia wanjuensis TaxID=3050585 RepID=UPI00254F74D7|nr:helix-turn-helix domain-containing protein [Lelliottia sp. V104_15]MDK9607078.1 helix-turn-helix domain-containing protein [Lelliottia sp. V104_15]